MILHQENDFVEVNKKNLDRYKFENIFVKTSNYLWRKLKHNN